MLIRSKKDKYTIPELGNLLDTEDHWIYSLFRNKKTRHKLGYIRKMPNNKKGKTKYILNRNQARAVYAVLQYRISGCTLQKATELVSEDIDRLSGE